MFSLKYWSNGRYCSLKCLNDDIRETETIINFYENSVKEHRNTILDEENGRINLSKEEVDKFKNELSKCQHRRVVLLQKLEVMKSLRKNGKLKYE